MRAADITREQWITSALVAVIVLLGVILFHFQGSNTETLIYGHSAIVWMVRKWSEATGTMSHGWLIPLGTAYFIWLRRQELKDAPKHVSGVGLTLVILCLLLHWVGLRVQQSRFALFAMIGLLWSIPFYFQGRHVARLLLFPCAFLLFCVPWNFLDQLTFPLRLFGSATAAFILNGLGTPTIRLGTALMSAEPGGFRVDVEDPCSGLRSLLAIMALAAAYGQISQKTTLRKWVLFALSLPIAMAANIVRIVALTYCFGYFDSALVQDLSHDYSGYVVFLVAVFLMMGVGALLNTHPIEKLQTWKSQNTGSTSSSSA